MTEHYYTNRPQVESKEEQLQVRLRGIPLTFYTDRGVFSRQRIDFGSLLMIESVQVKDNAKILDIGCGYGPLGLTLAKESSSRDVTMVDKNQRAILLAKKNAHTNGLSHVHILESDLFSAVESHDYDVILSNPPIRAGKSIVHRLFEESREYLSKHGELWIVIQKKQGAPSALKKLEDLFEVVEVVAKKKGYYIYKAVK